MSAWHVCLFRVLYGGDREHCVFSYISPTRPALIFYKLPLHYTSNIGTARPQTGPLTTPVSVDMSRQRPPVPHQQPRPNPLGLQQQILLT